MKTMRREHPFGTSLALYAGGDLGWKDRLIVALHLLGCRRCHRIVEQSRSIRDGVESHQNTTPPGLNWEVLAAEMKANIHLGFDAGAIVGSIPLEAEPPSPEPEAAGWRAAVVLASIGIVAAAGWYLNHIQSSLVPGVGSVATAWSAKSKSEGLELADRGSALTLLTPSRDGVRTDAGWGEAVRARYVDSESGLVTVSQVYADSE